MARGEGGKAVLQPVVGRDMERLVGFRGGGAFLGCRHRRISGWPFDAGADFPPPRRPDFDLDF